MGDFLNTSSENFWMSLNGMVYIDKSLLIAETNKAINTPQRFICLSRPRRFGKTMAIEMLSAYYGCGEETGALFDSLKIKKHESFPEHLNNYNCLILNMQEFLSESANVDDMLVSIRETLLAEFTEEFPGIVFKNKAKLTQTMKDAYNFSRRPFVVLIDEWDCVFRVHKEDLESQKAYLDFLRMWLKDQRYVALAYMTGILPIKKYGTHSALNMFSEYSMLNPRRFAPYFGFTEEEVALICKTCQVDMEEMRAWFDGYHMVYSPGVGEQPKAISIYSPKSVVESALDNSFGSYWNESETYEALKAYIQMDFDGLREAIVAMLSGSSILLNPSMFANDMSNFKRKDDVLTLLVHLGYLSYDSGLGAVSIPNKEVSGVFVDSITDLEWAEVIGAIKESRTLLESVWRLDACSVAQGVQKVHQEVSMLQYNDENALSYVVGLAFYTAREHYEIYRELPSGKGYADLVMKPKWGRSQKPALVVELKWDKSAHGAIEQIKEKRYMDSLKGTKEVLLVGINYDKASKEHECFIEKWNQLDL
ncbi:MAG: ATP-binding protein [Eubacteriaceae bacterium]|nr:ATP-binding protein [Eubacteriaceae bacterium]